MHEGHEKAERKGGNIESCQRHSISSFLSPIISKGFYMNNKIKYLVVCLMFNVQFYVNSLKTATQNVTRISYSDYRLQSSVFAP